MAPNHLVQDLGMVRKAADLYGLPLEEFTKARDSSPRSCGARGRRRQRTRSRRCASRRSRPGRSTSWPAGIPAETKALVRAGDELRKAQRAAVGGRGPEALRDASRAHRDRLDELTTAARDELGAAGATLQRVAQTLRGASVDKEASKALIAGTLSGDVEQSGFGPLLAAVPPSGFRRRAKPKAKPPPKPKPDPKAAKHKLLQEKLEKEQARLREARGKLERAGLTQSQTKAAKPADDEERCGDDEHCGRDADQAAPPHTAGGGSDDRSTRSEEGVDDEVPAFDRAAAVPHSRNEHECHQDGDEADDCHRSDRHALKPQSLRGGMRAITMKRSKPRMPSIHF